MMAWIYVWIVFIALTTTSAYQYSYPNHQQYLSQNLKYQTPDESLESKSDTLGDYQRRPEDVNSIYQEHLGESSLWKHKRPIKKSVPFKYNGKSIQDGGRKPTLHYVQPRNEHSSYKIAKSLPKSYYSVANEKEAVDLDKSFFFLGPKSAKRRMFTPEIPEECEELGICENSPDYPHEYVEALLAELPETSIMFNLDKETPEKPRREPRKSNQTVPLCKPNAKIMYPDKVRTKMGKWVFVVNGKDNKVQGFRGTLCVTEGKHCDQSVTFIDDYKPTCVQKNTDRSMWALDDKGEMVLVTTPVPSCCICELNKIKK